MTLPGLTKSIVLTCQHPLLWQYEHLLSQARKKIVTQWSQFMNALKKQGKHLMHDAKGLTACLQSLKLPDETGPPSASEGLLFSAPGSLPSRTSIRLAMGSRPVLSSASEDINQDDFQIPPPSQAPGSSFKDPHGKFEAPQNQAKPSCMQGPFSPLTKRQSLLSGKHVPHFKA